MESWDIYDENRLKTGKIIQRGRELKPGEYHLVVHICLFNSQGEMLIQQRQPFKEGWPNMWDVTAAGSAISGETSALAAQRELAEELGLLLDFSQQRPYLTTHFDNGFDDLYLLEAEVDVTTLTLQAEEVKQVKWASEAEILKLLAEGTFIPYYQDLVSLLFKMRGRRGVVKGN